METVTTRHTSSKQRSALAARMGQGLRLGGGEFRVGFVGTFRPWHDIDTLLHSASELAKNVPTRVLMVGDGPQRNHVLRTAWSDRAAR